MKNSLAVTQSRTLESLAGLEKAAILMLVAGSDGTGKILERLDMDEIKEIIRQMSDLGHVPGELVEGTLREFGARFGQTGAIIGSFESAERILSRFFDEDKVAVIMEEVRGPTGRTVWDKLGNVGESVLASYLRNEYPQTIAVVLSKIRPEHAARVLAQLPDDVAIEAVMRMLRMEVVQKEILKEVERTLRSEFMTNLSSSASRDNHEIMAEILNYMDRSAENRIFEMLEERNKQSADKVRALMFTFEDLSRLDGTGIQTLLRQADNAQLGLALKGASESLREQFLSNMSERAARLLRDDMDAAGPVRVRQVEEAQMMLVNLAKELAASGEIFLAEDGEDEMIV